MNAFHKILIANRGEIACRVMQTANRLGYSTVAVFSDADTQARHVQLADEAVGIGPAPVGESYLNIDNIIAAAKKSGADAIHPGYGFLSENARFAERCAQEGICFIGPPTPAIQLMGSKRESKIAMIEAGVPCVPGYEGHQQDADFLYQESLRIGFPLMIKASAGGGGRGMRRVSQESELKEAIQRARSEAENAFGSGELILEKAVDHARHVEIQVFGDHHGNYVFLGERDCSMQRRHQKVVEEAPSPAVTPALRKAMGEAAVKAAKACNYVGAGTVEFLLGSNGAFYFLEMNTRLQVEHPVTEMITGEDLVEWQIRVARGERLPKLQNEIQLNGHAIEVRLYAEDPANNFLPQTGPILSWQPANTNLARTDHGIREGTPVSRYYDPMLAKIICWGNTREDALRKLERALRHTILFGVTHNKGFLLDLLRSEAFRSGNATTHFIADHYGAQGWQPSHNDEEAAALAALALSNQPLCTESSTGQLRAINRRPLTLKREKQQYDITLDRPRNENHYRIHLQNGANIQKGDDAPTLQTFETNGTQLHYEWNGIRKSCHTLVFDDQIYVDLGEGPLRYEDHTHRPPQSQEGPGSGILKAPMDGGVTAVMVEPGQQVKKGETLLVIEAMKMEHLIKADLDGIVFEITTSKGQQVKGKQRLVTLKAAE